MTALHCWANPQIYRFRGSGAARFLKSKKRRPETILAKGLILAVVQLCGSLISINVVTVYAQQFKCRTGDGCRDSLTNDGELRANRKPRDDELLFILAFYCLVCCLGAYGLVKHRPAGSNIIFGIVVAALSFSTHVTTIPNYLVVNKLGLVNTCWALIIPKIAVAYNFFLVKQFCEQLPDSILEAARIDGARELHIFWKIAMPLLKPAWTTLAVFSFVSNWNDYFSPLIFIQSNALKTMPLALQTMSGGAGVVARAGTVGAATFLTTLPSILVFAIMRGKVMETMSYSGIKS